MIRTQIYLTYDFYQQVAAMAKWQNVPKAVVIRHLLEKGLKKERKTISARDALLNIASHASKKGPKDLSLHLDDYLYGEAS